MSVLTVSPVPVTQAFRGLCERTGTAGKQLGLGSSLHRYTIPQHGKRLIQDGTAQMEQSLSFTPLTQEKFQKRFQGKEMLVYEDADRMTFMPKKILEVRQCQEYLLRQP